jgi:hypothetical protein
VLPLVASAIVAPGCSSFRIGPPQDVQRHPVLDAAGQVHLLALGVNGATLAAELEVDRQQRGVANQSLKRMKAARDGGWC